MRHITKNERKDLFKDFCKEYPHVANKMSRCYQAMISHFDESSEYLLSEQFSCSYNEQSNEIIDNTIDVDN